MTAHYKAPGWFTRNVFNRAVAFSTRCGISVWGSRTLMVKGRTTGIARTTPVNLLTLDGEQYLVAPRGETQWVRNLRAADGIGVLLLGKKATAFVATELTDDEKPPVLRAYLKRWKAEVGVFFDGVSAKSPESELERIAPRHPVFKLNR
jgi:deazaflavin-dependent oxidoreductase (nitroreductase family)